MTPCALLTLVALVAAFPAARGARFAQAPGPAALSPAASSKPVSDLTYLVTAKNATFTSPGVLVLGGTGPTVARVDSGGAVKVYKTGYFADSSVGGALVSAEGTWLAIPQAVLYGANSAGNLSSVAISLQSVNSTASGQTLRFGVQSIAPDAASVEMKGGPVSAAVAASSSGQQPRLEERASTNQTWTSVTLAVESSRAALAQPASGAGTRGIFTNLAGDDGGWGRPSLIGGGGGESIPYTP